MGVVEAKIQTVEDIYRLVWTAVATKQPISALYKGFLPAILSAQIRPEPRQTTAGAVLSIWRGERERFGPDGLA